MASRAAPLHHRLLFTILALSATAHAQTTRPAFTLGKDTTVITEPLHPDGTVNYIPALNALLSQGVTNDNNAALLLLQITAGKLPDPDEVRQYCKSPDRWSSDAGRQDREDTVDR